MYLPWSDPYRSLKPIFSYFQIFLFHFSYHFFFFFFFIFRIVSFYPSSLFFVLFLLLPFFASSFLSFSFHLIFFFLIKQYFPSTSFYYFTTNPHFFSCSLFPSFFFHFFFFFSQTDSSPYSATKRVHKTRLRRCWMDRELDWKCGSIKANAYRALYNDYYLSRSLRPDTSTISHRAFEQRSSYTGCSLWLLCEIVLWPVALDSYIVRYTFRLILLLLTIMLIVYIFYIEFCSTKLIFHFKLRYFYLHIEKLIFVFCEIIVDIISRSFFFSFSSFSEDYRYLRRFRLVNFS